jgi:hypothetical protein
LTLDESALKVPEILYPNYTTIQIC